MIITLPPVGLKGEFRCILRNEDGSVAEDTGWFQNRIVDNGLITAGAASGTPYSTYGYIGDSGAATDDTQVAMTSLLAASGSFLPDAYDSPPVGPNYDRRAVRGWRFGAGAGTGTVREIGCGNNPTPSGNYLFARQVLGTPIVKGSTQTLDVYWALTKSFVLTDTTGQVTVDGILYDYIIRWQDRDADVNQNHWATLTPYPANTGMRVYTGALPAAVTDPNPQGSDLGTATNDLYIDNGSGYSDREYFYNLDKGNGTDLWRTFKYFLSDTTIVFMLEITATEGAHIGDGMPKDNTEEVRVTVRTTWSRAA